MGWSSDKDAGRSSFWNWRAMSIVGLYFPRHSCNRHSQNALLFLLTCQTAMCYWLSVRNPVFLIYSAKTKESHVLEYIICLFFLKAWSLSIFVLIWLRRYDRVMKVDIPSLNPFKLYLSHQERDSAPVIGFVSLCKTWMMCYRCSVRQLSLPVAPPWSPIFTNQCHTFCA